MVENPIKLFDLLGIPESELPDYSVRLNGNLDGYNVMDAYRNHKSQFLDHAHTIKFQGKGRKIHTRYVLQFVELKPTEWLFIGLFEVSQPEIQLSNGNFALGYRMLDRYSALEGRLVARFDRPSNYQGSGNLTRNLSTPSVREYSTKHMIVDRVARSSKSILPFPGFNKLRLNHSELVAAVENPEWAPALNSVSAVYLQTDMSNGWHYVGSAYSREGDNMGLLSRWKEYAYYDHDGTNTRLKKLSREHIEEHFQYSVLEVFDPSTKPSKIIQREHWWMDTLGSVYKDEHPFGYNTVRQRKENTSGELDDSEESEE